MISGSRVGLASAREVEMGNGLPAALGLKCWRSIADCLKATPATLRTRPARLFALIRPPSALLGNERKNSPGWIFSDVQAEVAGDNDHDHHDADDIKDVHWIPPRIGFSN
jgi:hypothetical protein